MMAMRVAGCTGACCAEVQLDRRTAEGVFALSIEDGADTAYIRDMLRIDDALTAEQSEYRRDNLVAFRCRWFAGRRCTAYEGNYPFPGGMGADVR